MLSHLSRVQFFATLWAVAQQAPLSIGFSWQEYWSRFPLPTLGELSDPGIKPVPLALAGRFFTTEPPGKPLSPGIYETALFIAGVGNVCLWPPHMACRILVPQPGIEPVPLQRKHRVLTAGPPGKSWYLGSKRGKTLKCMYRIMFLFGDKTQLLSCTFRAAPLFHQLLK